MVQRILASLSVLVFAYTSVGFFTNATLVRLAAGIVAVYLINTTIFKYKGRRRAMSTSSAVMAMGGFPVASRMPDPIINIYLYFDVLPSMESLKTLAREHMIRFERFHSIPVPGENDTHVWQPVRVHVDDHFTEHEAKDAADVDQIAQKIVDGPLRYPLGPRWEFHLISNESAPATVSSSNSSTSSSPSSSSSGDNESKSSSASTVKQPKNRHLLIVRIDHSIGDGIALVAIFNRLLCDEKGRPLSETQKDFVRKDSDKLSGLDLAVSVFKSLAKVLTLPSGPFDTGMVFNGCGPKKLQVYSGHRRVVKVDPVSLDLIKALKNAAGVTVNDICYAATAGAIRRYCIAQGDPAFKSSSSSSSSSSGVSARSLLPLAFPRSQDALKNYQTALRNLWTFVSAPLPVHLDTPKARLDACTAALSALKKSAEAPVGMVVSDIVQAVAPLSFVRQTVGDLFSRHSLVFSNVPGADTPVTLGGQSIREIQMVYPNLITQIGMISYCNTVFMNFTIDDNAVPDAQSISRHFHAELRDLCAYFKVKWIDPVNV